MIPMTTFRCLEDQSKILVWRKNCDRRVNGSESFSFIFQPCIIPVHNKFQPALDLAESLLPTLLITPGFDLPFFKASQNVPEMITNSLNDGSFLRLLQLLNILPGSISVRQLLLLDDPIVECSDVGAAFVPERKEFPGKIKGIDFLLIHAQGERRRFETKYKSLPRRSEPKFGEHLDVPP